MPTKQPKPVDLSEYAEERIPFDTVIRKLSRVKTTHATPAKPKRARAARKRK